MRQSLTHGKRAEVAPPTQQNRPRRCSTCARRLRRLIAPSLKHLRKADSVPITAVGARRARLAIALEPTTEPPSSGPSGASMPAQRILAVGIGCRAGVPGDVIAELVEKALARAGEETVPVALFTIVDKQSEAGIGEAAARLGLALVHLPRAALDAVADRVETRSERVVELFGVPAIAEGAALAGAGIGARLVVPRMAERGATVAVAIGR